MHQLKLRCKSVGLLIYFRDSTQTVKTSKKLIKHTKYKTYKTSLLTILKVKTLKYMAKSTFKGEFGTLLNRFSYILVVPADGAATSQITVLSLVLHRWLLVHNLLICYFRSSLYCVLLWYRVSVPCGFGFRCMNLWSVST